MDHPISDAALDQLFREARTANAWAKRDVPEVLIRAVYDLMKMGPTSANTCPARFLWIRSDAAKQKLKPFLMEANVKKVMQAPWTVVLAWDQRFEQQLTKLFPHEPSAKDWFSDPQVHAETLFRNATLQGAYLILAARALGLDCGPMSGFDRGAVDEAFFANDPNKKHWKSNFICALGYSDERGLFPRSPRLSFEEAGEII